jgi:hypothetical protein
VLQSQTDYLIAMIGGQPTCTPLSGGGGIKVAASGDTDALYYTGTLYYDSACTKPYITTSATMSADASSDALNIVAAETYYGLNGTAIGSMALNETAVVGDDVMTVYGLGVFTPAGGRHSSGCIALSRRPGELAVAGSRRTFPHSDWPSARRRPSP